MGATLKMVFRNAAVFNGYSCSLFLSFYYSFLLDFHLKCVFFHVFSSYLKMRISFHILSNYKVFPQYDFFCVLTNLHSLQNVCHTGCKNIVFLLCGSGHATSIHPCCQIPFHTCHTNRVFHLCGFSHDT